MPLQVEYDLQDKEKSKKRILEALMDSSNPRENARSLKEFVKGDENLKSNYKTLFKHELLSNFNEIMEDSLRKYDAGDVILLADKLNAEENIEDMIYEKLRIKMAK